MSLFRSAPLGGRIRFTALFCALFLFVSGPVFAAGPLESLAEVQRGIDACDSDRVTRVLDIPAVVGKASDSLLDTLQREAADGNLGDSDFAMVLAIAGVVQEGGQAAMLRQLLISEVRGFIVSGVNGGYFAGEPNGSVNPSRASLASALSKMPQGRRQIVPGKILSQEVGKARVSGVFIDPQAGRLPLELLMEERDGVWQVTEIANARDLFQEAARHNKR